MDEELLTEIQKNNRLLLASIVLQAQNISPEGERIELVLAKAGLTYQEIAQVLHKKPDAVRMMLARNKPAKNI